MMDLVLKFRLLQEKKEAELPTINGYRFGWVDPRKTLEELLGVKLT